MHICKSGLFLFALVIGGFTAGAMLLSRTVEVLPASAFAADEPAAVSIILDAGHGGEDGGAVSCTGVNESEINLAVTLRLDAFLHAIGRKTVLLRSEDVSLHTGDCRTISEKKVSDLRHRVELVNGVENGILVSIHQNQYPESKYHGAQVFYAPTKGSDALAESLQSELSAALDPRNRRQCKPAGSVYLMNKVQCPAVLAECGFLSNREEEARLRDENYQKKLAIVIGCTVSRWAQGMNIHES